MSDKQTRDAWVLEVQEWLNSEYGNVSGFGSVPEDGKIGWDTVNGLIRAVQHELGIEDLVNNFGETTQALWDQQVTPRLLNGFKSNFVKLIDGAFRCKGMGTGKFDDTYSSENDDATKQLKREAGFTEIDSSLDSMWAKALFDMSAFVLVPGGDESTREMQRELNKKYYEYTGILPTDGIYQRATNTALIYGIQVEIGLGEVANGNFGPATQNAYGQLAANHQIDIYTDLVLLIQYALYQNLRALDPTTNNFNGSLGGVTADNLSLFQDFMMLTEVEVGYPDLRTMMSLVLSSGSSDRGFEAIDTATQLTNAEIDTLANAGVKYFGRYLTGTVGNNFVPKYLKKSEAEYIISKGLSIVPIYQDNNPIVSYYTAAQGISDAKAAIKAATKLGLPAGTTIYFAVDVDALDSDVTTNIVPYFQGVASQIGSGSTGSKYTMGVYGTRNVCTRVSDEAGAVASYVSNMSTGWSGNLGFSQPINWTFDQFAEPEGGIGGISIDKVSVSHNDEGAKTIEATSYEAEKAVLKSMGWGSLDGILNESFEFDKEYVLADFGSAEFVGTASTTISDPDPSMVTININKGVPEFDVGVDLEELLGADAAGKVTTAIGALGVEISKGALSAGIEKFGDELTVSFSAVIEDEETSEEVIQVSQGCALKFDLTKLNNFMHTMANKVGEFLDEHKLELCLLGILIVAGAIVSLGVVTLAALLKGLAMVASLALGVFVTD